MTDGNNATVSTVHTLHTGTGPNEQLDKTLQALWELESFGIDPDNSTSPNHPTFAVKLKDGRYEVSQNFTRRYQINYNLSLRRLNGLLQRLRRDPKILQEYCTIIQDQLDRDIIEMVESHNKHPTRIHYLPHHAVVKARERNNKNTDCI